MLYKTLILTVLLIAGGTALCQPQIDFEQKTVKFEKTKAGEVLFFEYAFLNSGNEPLIISEVKVTCGCTKPEYPSVPVRPGESGKIKVSFDTKGKIGYQDRILEVISNAKNPVEKIRFKGMVDNKNP